MLEAAYAEVLRDTIERMEKTGSPVITDGEQTKPSFATYPLSGLTNLAPDGVIIPFADGHTRQLPRLSAPPFRYGVHAAAYLVAARRYTQLPIKQAVISTFALSLLYPSEPISSYSREEFLADLINEAEADIRGALDAGAASVQIDFTEARLSLKLDPTGGLLRSFVALNNKVLDRFTDEGRQRIGKNANFYRDSGGAAIPILRDHGQPRTTMQQLAGLESVLGDYGGPLSSFQWVFSPRGPDGRPQPLFNRVTGAIDPGVASYWRTHYDIVEYLSSNWNSVGSDLRGKIHLVVGTDDTLYLDGAAHRLESVLNRLGGQQHFTFLPGRSHFNVYVVGEDRFALFDQIAAEMYQVARPTKTKK
jgi:hypothetical protein